MQMVARRALLDSTPSLERLRIIAKLHLRTVRKWLSLIWNLQLIGSFN
jgi:hypothetical protein